MPTNNELTSILLSLPRELQSAIIEKMPPQTMVGRPAGRPPPVISSKPAIPLRAFFNCGKARDAAAVLRFNGRAITEFFVPRNVRSGGDNNRDCAAKTYYP